MLNSLCQKLFVKIFAENENKRNVMWEKNKFPQQTYINLDC